jgi:hypothetical protein
VKAGLPDLARGRELVAERGLSPGSPITIFDETTSTNDEAKRAAKEGAPNGATWVADSGSRASGPRMGVTPPREPARLSARADRMPALRGPLI